MSTKSTIFLTKDNEHWYQDVSEPRFIDGEFIGYDIIVEFDKSNLVGDYEDDVTMMIRGDSELAKMILKAKQ